MLAVKYSRPEILLELLQESSIMNNAMTLLQDGLNQRELKAALEKQKKHETIIFVDLVKQACSGMHEAKSMFFRIHARLADVSNN